MKTQGLQNFTYGKIEARIKLPSGKGLWPAFWMLGQDILTVNWPECGEIDIMEHINRVTYINGTMHWDNNGTNSSYGETVSFTDPSLYHIYSVEWSPDSIKWFFDQNYYCGATIANNINST